MSLTWRAATRSARAMKTSKAISVLQGRIHPPLAANTTRTPRDWTPSDLHANAQRGGKADGGLPLIVMCHATGFCKETWLPVVEELAKLARSPLRWIAIDFSGHGDSRRHPQLPPAWSDTFKSDVLHTLDEMREGAEVVVGVGHSMGGAALLHAALDRPSLFASLVLLEPVVLDRARMQQVHSMVPEDVDEQMARLALKRRSAWESIEDAEKYFRSRKAFAKFTEHAMQAVLWGGLKTSEDGLGVVLKCTPDQEAEAYRGRGADPVNLWSRLGEVSCATCIGAGEEAPPPMDKAHFEELARNLRHSGFEAAPKCGHFVVQEDPAWVARLIGSSCSELIPSCFGGVSMKAASKL